MNKNEIIKLLDDNSNYDELRKKADEIRKKHKGDGVHLRGLIEFSSYCAKNCTYCGIRAENKNLKRFRLDKDEILDIARHGKELGYKTVVLQSGEDLTYTIDKMQDIISNIKKLDLALTLSLGEKTFEEYKAYREAGADRYLLRIETCEPELYKKLHPNSSHKNRFKCLENLKELGYEAGTGIMTGLPQQTLASIAEDILFFKRIEADMIGLGPFVPSPNTPLSHKAGGSFELAIRAMAIVRILMPDINIPATSAMETIKENGRFIALESGANVVMPNLAPKSAKFYTIYPKKSSDWSNIATAEANEKLSTINRFVSKTKGFKNDIG